MCGIVGRAGNLIAADEKVFKTLLLLDWFRGQDSTGVFSLSKTYNTRLTLKIADDPIMLMKHSEFESTVSGGFDCLWIGHNRASTIGASTRENAHPFTHGTITGVHNGTLEQDSFKELAQRLQSDYGTDSETIFAHMAEYGLEETVSRLRGAWAFVWYDSKDKSLNMLRNKERPLYLCEVERKSGTSESKILTWASEYEMIEAARSMAKDPGSLVCDEEGYCYFPLPVDVHHKWYMDDIKNGKIEPILTEMKGLPPTPKNQGVLNTFTNTVTSSAPPTTYKILEDKVEEVAIHLSEDSPGHVLGGHLTEEEWNNISKYGCSFCGSDVDLEMEGLAIYPEEGVVLCPICSEQKHTTINESFSTSNVINQLK
jgi:hypothetical protein